MAERTWVAVILCCIVWFSYIKWFAPPPAQPGVQTTQTTGDKTASTSTTSAGTPEAAAPAGGLFSSKPVLLDSITLNAGNMNLVFSDAGGKISHVSLNQFPEFITPNSPRIQPVTPTTTPFALAALFSDPSLQKLGTGVFQHQQTDHSVNFKAASDGVELSKEYGYTEGSYYVDAKYHLTFPAGTRTDWGYLVLPVGGTSLEYEAGDPLRDWEVVSYQNDSVTRKPENKLKEAALVQQGNTSWLAFGNRYFATVVINEAKINPDVVFAKDPALTGGYLRYPLLLKQGERSLDFAVKYYVGPKDYSHLSKVAGLRELINYGTFSKIAYPILELLKLFYKWVHNYGVAIIVLTIFVRLIFYPLSAKGARSMKAMQKLQPQITALKAKYKDDMQRFNQEQMALFKTHKVNPMGGCIPMLLQLPVFIALYAVLGYSIELFHAPFFGWIQDLSAKDPFYILPVLMGVSMLGQQKLTSTAMMDPMQQKMMLFMPVIMTVFMAKLPSGLTLYIFLSTVLGIVQQVMVNRDNKSEALAQAPSRA